MGLAGLTLLSSTAIAAASTSAAGSKKGLPSIDLIHAASSSGTVSPPLAAIEESPLAVHKPVELRGVSLLLKGTQAIVTNLGGGLLFLALFVVAVIARRESHPKAS